MIIKIDFEKPSDVSLEEIAAFVHDALSSWGGQFHPDDPLFHSLRGRMKSVAVHGKKFTVPESDG